MTARSYRDVVLADRPWFYSRLDERGIKLNNLGTLGSWLSGTGANGGVTSGTDTTAGFGDGSTGSAFNGSGYIDLAGLASAPGVPTTACSIEFWIKPGSYTAGCPVAMNTGTSNGRAYAYFPFNSTNGQCYWDFGGGGSQGYTRLAWVSAIQQGKWSHCVVVSTNGFQAAYLNGALEASGSLATGAFVGSTGSRIGDDGYSEFFVGSMKDLAIYSRVLTPGEIANHYAARTAGQGAAWRRSWALIAGGAKPLAGTSTTLTSEAQALLAMAVALASSSTSTTSDAAALLQLAQSITGTSSSTTSEANALLNLAQSLAGSSSTTTSEAQALLLLAEALAGTSTTSTAEAPALLQQAQALAGSSTTVTSEAVALLLQAVAMAGSSTTTTSEAQALLALAIALSGATTSITGTAGSLSLAKLLSGLSTTLTSDVARLVKLSTIYDAEISRARSGAGVSRVRSGAKTASVRSGNRVVTLQ